MVIDRTSLPPIALGARLIKSPNIKTLGLKPNFSDYSSYEQKLILTSKKIYFPTAFYAEMLNIIGKKTFPNFHTYKFVQDKIRQTAIFKMLDIPHPGTRTFYGRKQKIKILNYFNFPFIGKKPRGSSQGRDVFLIKNIKDLKKYLLIDQPAYIQEYIPVGKDIRVVIIGDKIRIAYFREAGINDFRTNISQGGKIKFADIPKPALDLALNTAKRCGWDDVGIDIIQKKNKFFIIEANMKYGTKGFKKAGIDYKNLLENLVLSKEI